MDRPTDDDAALMLAWVAGDAASFPLLYSRQKDRLYRFILRSVRQREVAEEIFQETWSRAIAARERYQPGARFSTWLLQIAHNLIVDAFRRQRPESTGEAYDTAVASHPGDERSQPEHALSDFQQRRRLQQAIDRLPGEQRVVFLLRMENELTIEEIGDVTGVGRETAKSRLRYAMNRIRELMTP
ncbi:RNA polymerase sigma factor [Pinirhizobacter sp.]|uniref:RNA polymerase sigma factor n=1 Tax=Pinirhizobacter sp. TaxID=2950432 RepID=UPI002F40588B